MNNDIAELSNMMNQAAGLIPMFSTTCPQCGPNGTQPVQDRRAWVLTPDCETCRKAVMDRAFELGRQQRMRLEQAVFQTMIGSRASSTEGAE